MESEDSNQVCGPEIDLDDVLRHKYSQSYFGIMLSTNQSLRA